ncbi:hypothetical protein ACU21_09075 [Actinobaculum suis]|nr:hypothetical protein ACU21_09075 [Actinobaculum suis]OCA95916.1 hypothetical protein ACU20_03545 [Actinobaculum suis]
MRAAPRTQTAELVPTARANSAKSVKTEIAELVPTARANSAISAKAQTAELVRAGIGREKRTKMRDNRARDGKSA